MNINRQTYEEYFLLYTDNELNPEEKKAVEEFISENPDLQQELMLLQDTIFKSDESILFEDKELLYRHTKKAVVMPWFRLAAAAIAIFTLTLAGWLYLGSGSTSSSPNRLVTRELIEEKPRRGEELNKVEPVLTASSDRYESPSDRLNIKPEGKQVSAVLAVRVIRDPAKVQESDKAEIEREENQNASLNVAAPEPSDLTHTLGNTESSTEVVDVAVAPRGLRNEHVLTASLQEPVVEYVEGEENDMIYFANTSLPKKTKLRGVFRKATRFLDKVTSIQ